MSKLNEEKKQLWNKLVRKRSRLFGEQAAQEPDVYIGGRVTKVQFPDVKYVNPIYKTLYFWIV